ncbi:MAG: signal peptidase II, partial [Terriglobia bacterium]
MSATAANKTRTLYLLLGGASRLLDPASKWVVAHWLPLGETRRVVPGLFNLTHVRNRGAAFGLLADLPAGMVQVFLVAFSTAALVLVLTLLWRRPASR